MTYKIQLPNKPEKIIEDVNEKVIERVESLGGTITEIN